MKFKVSEYCRFLTIGLIAAYVGFALMKTDRHPFESDQSIFFIGFCGAAVFTVVGLAYSLMWAYFFAYGLLGLIMLFGNAALFPIEGQGLWSSLSFFPKYVLIISWNSLVLVMIYFLDVNRAMRKQRIG